MKRALALLFLVLPAMAYAGKPLFIVERSTNANQLIFELGDSPKEPIHAYWKMLAQDGHVEEETSLEKSYAYKVEIIEKSETQIRFQVKSLPSLPITVRLGNDPVAVINSGGQDRVLDKVFCEIGGGIFPSLKALRFSFRPVPSSPILATN